MENPLAAYEAAKEYFNAMLADGTLDCVYVFVTAGGVTIANADSHEELWEKITASPLFPFLEWEAHALADFSYTFDKTIERLQQMMTG